MKGISPMIATVLLIAFTVAIGGLIITWLQSLTSVQTTSIGSSGEKAAQCGTTSLLVKEVRYATGSNRVNVTIVHTSGTQPLRNVSVTVIGGGLSNSSNTTFTDTDFKSGQTTAFSVDVTSGAKVPPELVTAGAFCATTYGLQAECKSGQSCMVPV